MLVDFRDRSANTIVRAATLIQKLQFTGKAEFEPRSATLEEDALPLGYRGALR